MLRFPVRIYLAANAIVYAFFGIGFFPEGLLFGFLAFFVSLLASVPALLILLCFFHLLERLRPGRVASWLLLALTTGVSAFSPALCFNLSAFSFFERDNTMMWLSLSSAFGALLLLSPSLNKYFQLLHHEPEEFNQIN